jgi:hypothetical protein
LEGRAAPTSPPVGGGEEPARIAGDSLARLRPAVEDLREAHGAGRIHQDLVHLAWSHTHMHCNRLGIGGTAEAILRYFMNRLHQEEGRAGP